MLAVTAPALQLERPPSGPMTPQLSPRVTMWLMASLLLTPLQYVQGNAPIVTAGAHAAAAACACTEQKWCSPIATPLPQKEIFAFALAGGGANMPTEPTKQQWPRFNWDLVTTIAWDIGANETVCFAHSRGVRVVIPASGPFALYGGVQHGRLCEPDAEWDCEERVAGYAAGIS